MKFSSHSLTEFQVRIKILKGTCLKIRASFIQLPAIHSVPAEPGQLSLSPWQKGIKKQLASLEGDVWYILISPCMLLWM